MEYRWTSVETASIGVEVIHPDIWFAGSATMVLLPLTGADLSIVPSGATVVYADAAGIAAARAHMGQQNRRLLLQAGVTYHLDPTFPISKGCHIGAPLGSTDRAIISDAQYPAETGNGPAFFATFSGDDGEQACVMNLDFSTSYRTDDPQLGQTRRNTGFGGAGNILIFNCNTSGVAGWGNMQNDAAVVNSRISNWWNYASYCDHEFAEIFFVGAAWIQPPGMRDVDWPNVPEGARSLYRQYRYINPATFVHIKCVTQDYQGFLPQQPTQRSHTAERVRGEMRIVQSQCYVGGAGPASIGKTVSSFRKALSGADDDPGGRVYYESVQIDMCIVDASIGGLEAINFDLPATYVRNCLIRFGERIGPTTGGNLRPVVLMDPGENLANYNEFGQAPNIRDCCVAYNAFVADMEIDGTYGPGTDYPGIEMSRTRESVYTVLGFDRNAYKIHPKHHNITGVIANGIDEEGRPYTTGHLVRDDATDPWAPVRDITGARRDGVTYHAPHHAAALAAPHVFVGNVLT
ncbi:MAG: hypothetical protein AAF711_20530, partial [Planctomycetota bacterium]